MDVFDRKFYKREQKLRRNYGLDESLYMRLKELPKIYEATVGDLLNASLERFITSGKIALSEKIDCANVAMHPFSIRESNVAGLEKLKEKYGLSVQQMVNSPIKNALDDCSQPQEQTIKIDPSLSKIKARGFLPAFRPVAASIRDAQGLHLVGPRVYGFRSMMRPLAALRKPDLVPGFLIAANSSFTARKVYRTMCVYRM